MTSLALAPVAVVSGLFARVRRLIPSRVRPASRLFIAASLCALVTFPPTSEAQVSVGDGGTPGYSMPVAVPPGIAGMSPKLGLLYSGGGVNGPVGLGWSIQGLSSVTRCSPSFAIDGKRGGVGYVASDKLCLDGQRLVQTDITGAPLAFPQANDAQGLGSGQFREYRTEKDSYARVRAFGYANGDITGASGPAYFRVWTKSGQVYEYGAGPNADANTKALVSAQGGTVPMVWAVSRISDTLGNFIDFKYEQRDSVWGSGPVTGTPTPGREWNILEIQYSGNKVLFTYGDRPAQQPQDVGEAYHQGTKNISRRLLQSITTYINSPNTAATGQAGGAVAVKTTKLTYDNGPITKRSRVIKIQDCAGGSTSTKCLPATTFTYAAGGNDAFQLSASFNASPLATVKMQDPTGTSGTLLGDFDGDGKLDILYWADNPALNALYLSNGDGTFRNVPPGAGAGQFNITDQNLFKSGQCNYTVVADFNGDGINDLLRYSPSGCSGGAPTYLYLGKGDGSFNRVTVTTLPSLQSRTSRDVFNCIVYDSVNHTTCLEIGTNFGWTAGSSFYLMDVDGDGKLDVITTILPAQPPTSTSMPPPSADDCLTSTCTHVYLGDGAGGFAEVSTNLAHKSIYSDQSINRFRPGRVNYVADFNGDGLSDLIGISTTYFQSAAAWLSRGDGNFDPVVNAGYVDCFLPLDFNGDRKPDCLHPGSQASANTLAVGAGGATLSNVAGFNLTQGGQELQTQNISTFALTAGTQLIDINGDGRTDLLRWKDDPAQNAVYISNGDGTFTPSATFNLGGATPVQLQNSDGTASFLLGDFTGHGTTEILRLQTVGAVVTNQLYVRSDATPADQLYSVTGPTGAITTLYYVPLSNATPNNGFSGALGARYVNDRAAGMAVTPNKIDLTIPMYVVATSIADSGVGLNKVTTEYSYKGLKADINGRGLLGFREVLRQSPGSNGGLLTVDTQFLTDQPYIGVADRTETYRSALNATAAASRLSSTVNIYCDKTSATGADTAALANGFACPTSAKVQRPYLLKTTEIGKDLASFALPTVVTQNTYNSAGDPTQIVVTASGTTATVAQTFTKSTVNQYQADYTACPDYQTCSWVLGRLVQSTVTSTVPNSLPSIPAVAGSGPNATATSGTGALQAGVLTPTLNFGSVVVGATSTLGATLANDGATSLSVTVPSAASVVGTDFSFVSTTCTANLAVGSSCNVTVMVSPTAAGARNGTLALSTGAGSLSSSLSATGAVPAVTIIPGWVNWGTVGAGSDSGDVPTVMNNSAVPVFMTAHSVVSGPPGVWSWQGNGTPNYCQPGMTVLAPGASCKSYFGTGTLATPGSYTAVDQFSYQAQGLPASTFNVQQTYTFSVATTTASATSLAFGNVVYNGNGAMNLTLSNGADMPMENVALSVSGSNAGNFVVSSNACGAAVPAHGSCIVAVTFTPGGVANGFVATLTATGSYSRYTADGKQSYYPSTQSLAVGLSGNGYGSRATLTSTSTLAVPATWYGSAAQTTTATYRNDGSAPMTLATPLLPAPLSVTSNNCSAVAATGSCSMVITAATNVPGVSQSQSFTPAGANSGPAATTVTWTTYAAVARWGSASLAFGNVTVGTSATQNITLYNDGNAAYNWALNSGIANAPGGYSFNTSACSSVAPGGGSCNVVVTFTPPAAASYSGSNISMASASFSNNTFSVSGSGITPPSISASAASISGTSFTPTPASASVSFTNSGQTATTLALSVTGGNSVSPATLNCPGAGPCGSATVSSPAAVGSYSGVLSGTSSAGGSVPPVSASLTVLINTGTLSVSPGAVTLTGQYAAAPTYSGAITVTNAGPRPVLLASLASQVPGAGAYGTPYLEMGSDNCSGQTLASGGSCTFTVAFTSGCPLASTRTWTLNITGTNAANTVQFVVTGRTLAGLCA